jgi:predicted RNA-binding Zn-ribbon protein involved in translation (DUF1610 family)
MIICQECAREMRCTKTGIVLRYSGHWCKRGDAFACPTCGARAIHLSNCNEGYHEDTPHLGDTYLDMAEGE